MNRALTREELTAIKVAVNGGRMGWSDEQIDRRIQDVHSGAYTAALNKPTETLTVRDLADCFRCGGACGPHQCMEGMKTPRDTSTDWVRA